MPVDIFISYARKDKKLRDELILYLSTIRNQGLMNDWDDEDILPGTVWEQGIFERLHKAHVILLLISPNFVASRECCRQMEWALEQHKAHAACVIPILLRATDIEQNLLGDLQALPHNHKPVSRWSKRDEAFLDIAQGIRAVIEAIQKNIKATGGIDMSSASPSFWSIPLRRNLLFTGREQVLTSIHEALYAKHIVALSGLGGIGKTQIATEYVYQHRNEYQAAIWIQADSEEEIVAGFVNIATLLDLPEKGASAYTIAVQAVLQWLTQHKNWLLIFDNVDDFNVIHSYLPSGDSGHILLTTRVQAMSGVAHKIEIYKMYDEEAVQFLFLRAGIADQGKLPTETTHELHIQAIQIIKEVDGLPLAIDQAGAYVEETGCGFSTYLQLYHQQHAQLLAYRGQAALDYPFSVSTTWLLSFQEIERINPSASTLLQLCAFLSPESIPEEILSRALSCAETAFEPIVDDIFALNNTIKILLTYSLLYRNHVDQTVSVHGLVQTVIQDQMDMHTRKIWAGRAIEALAAALIDITKDSPFAQRYIAHALVCVNHIEQWDIESARAAHLLYEVARYLRRQSQLVEAFSLCQRALEMHTKILGGEHPDVADILNLLAHTSYGLGRYVEAAEQYQGSLAIWEKTYDLEHPAALRTMYHLARVHKRQGNYLEAASLYQKVFSLQERILGAEHHQTLETSQEMANLFIRQGKYTEAGSMLEKILPLQKKILGPEHLDTALTLYNLAIVYHKQKSATEALPFALEALTIAHKEFGTIHLTTAAYRLKVGQIYASQGRYVDAIPLLQETLQAYESLLGAEHLYTAMTLNNLGEAHHKQGNDAAAFPLFQRALAIAEKTLHPDHPEMASFCYHLGRFYYDEDQYVKAAPLYERALAIREHVLGAEHPTTIEMRHELANLIHKIYPGK